MKGPRSAESIQRMRDAASQRHDANAERLHEKVRLVIQTISDEMEANDGIYPLNKGSVSMAEVARRAEIHPLTFHKPRYVGLASEVRDWLSRLKRTESVTRTQVRSDLQSRVKQWRELYEGLMDSHRKTETDLRVALLNLAEVQEEVATLREKLARESSVRPHLVSSKGLK